MIMATKLIAIIANPIKQKIYIGKYFYVKLIFIPNIYQLIYMYTIYLIHWMWLYMLMGIFFTFHILPMYCFGFQKYVPYLKIILNLPYIYTYKITYIIICDNSFFFSQQLFLNRIDEYQNESMWWTGDARPSQLQKLFITICIHRQTLIHEWKNLNYEK